MLIGITAAMIVALGFGAFVVLFAASAMARRSVDSDPGLEEQPLESWSIVHRDGGLNTSTRLRLS